MEDPSEDTLIEILEVLRDIRRMLREQKPQQPTIRDSALCVYCGRSYAPILGHVCSRPEASVNPSR